MRTRDGTSLASVTVFGTLSRQDRDRLTVADAGSLSRNQLFAGLSLIGIANGISERSVHSVITEGFVGAVLNTFDISVLVWGAVAISASFLLRAPLSPMGRADRAVALCALVAFVLPIAPLSWLALTGMAAYLAATSPRTAYFHRGACILLAVTVPMFWGRLLFAVFSDTILRADATLVGWIVGTERLGNAIRFADGEGYLWIAPACSSLANISLAILCWITVTKVLGRSTSLRDLGWIAAACTAVILINVVRISLLGLFRQSFDLIHGPVGSAVANLLILAATVGICLLGVRRDIPARI